MLYSASSELLELSSIAGSRAQASTKIAVVYSLTAQCDKRTGLAAEQRVKWCRNASGAHRRDHGDVAEAANASLRDHEGMHGQYQENAEPQTLFVVGHEHCRAALSWRRAGAEPVGRRESRHWRHVAYGLAGQRAGGGGGSN
eukprot:4841325-Prymnesium_polylepis.1